MSRNNYSGISNSDDFFNRTPNGKGTSSHFEFRISQVKFKLPAVKYSQHEFLLYSLFSLYILLISIVLDKAHSVEIRAVTARRARSRLQSRRKRPTARLFHQQPAAILSQATFTNPYSGYKHFATLEKSKCHKLWPEKASNA